MAPGDEERSTLTWRDGASGIRVDARRCSFVALTLYAGYWRRPGLMLLLVRRCSRRSHGNAMLSEEMALVCICGTLGSVSCGSRSQAELATRRYRGHAQSGLRPFGTACARASLLVARSGGAAIVATPQDWECARTRQLDARGQKACMAPYTRRANRRRRAPDKALPFGIRRRFAAELFCSRLPRSRFRCCLAAR